MIAVSSPLIGQEELDAIKPVFESGWLGLGSNTYCFEKEVSKFLEAKNVIAVNTGTSALHLALDAFGIGRGDEVIVPSLTYAASIQPIINLGAVPIFCEVQEQNLLIDLNNVESLITSNTKAVMPIHYCGNPCDMDRLIDMSKKYNFKIIEDAAHAFGSSYKGRKIGSFGDATCFSFDPIKVITCGEGGAVVLGDNEIAEEIRKKRLLGINKDTWHRYKNERNWFYEVTTTGYRYHMSNINAAIGLVQLNKLDHFISRRRWICEQYDNAFKELDFITPLKINYDDVAPFMYIIRVPGKQTEFMEFLGERGIGTGVHYIANHIHPLFRKYSSSDLPLTTRLWNEIVTIPLHCRLSDNDVQKVIENVMLFEGEISEKL